MQTFVKHRHYNWMGSGHAGPADAKHQCCEKGSLCVFVKDKNEADQEIPTLSLGELAHNTYVPKELSVPS